MRDTARR
jgi:imidazolonepropionase-like amidohydrolase